MKTSSDIETDRRLAEEGGRRFGTLVPGEFVELRLRRDNREVSVRLRAGYRGRQ